MVRRDLAQAGIIAAQIESEIMGVLRSVEGAALCDAGLGASRAFGTIRAHFEVPQLTPSPSDIDFGTLDWHKRTGERLKRCRALLLSEPHLHRVKGWAKAEKAFSIFRSKLDDKVCGDFPDEPDLVVLHCYYGD